MMPHFYLGLMGIAWFLDMYTKLPVTGLCKPHFTGFGERMLIVEHGPQGLLYFSSIWLGDFYELGIYPGKKI